MKEIDFKLHESKLLVQSILTLGKNHQIENDLIKLIGKKSSPTQKKLILQDTVDTYKWVRDVVIKVCGYYAENNRFDSVIRNRSGTELQ